MAFVMFFRIFFYPRWFYLLKHLMNNIATICLSLNFANC
jgi:hypothetical protein